MTPFSLCNRDDCVYCRVPLSPRHEHDHMPRPGRHGGKYTECACLNCHDLKDRVPLGDWAVEDAWTAFAGVWEKSTTLERIILAKIAALFADTVAADDDLVIAGGGQG